MLQCHIIMKLMSFSISSPLNMHVLNFAMCWSGNKIPNSRSISSLLLNVSGLASKTTAIFAR